MRECSLLSALRVGEAGAEAGARTYTQYMPFRFVAPLWFVPGGPSAREAVSAAEEAPVSAGDCFLLVNGALPDDVECCSAVCCSAQSQRG